MYDCSKNKDFAKQFAWALKQKNKWNNFQKCVWKVPQQVLTITKLWSNIKDSTGRWTHAYTP